MLQALCDFTIPRSFCHLFYQNLEGKVFYKGFERHSGDGFYINGDIRNKKGNVFNQIFTATDKKKFKNNLKECYVPKNIL